MSGAEGDPIPYDPACCDCRRDAGKDLAGTTWQCWPHIARERDDLRAEIERLRDEAKHLAAVFGCRDAPSIQLCRGTQQDILRALRHLLLPPAPRHLSAVADSDRVAPSGGDSGRAQ